MVCILRLLVFSNINQEHFLGRSFLLHQVSSLLFVPTWKFLEHDSVWHRVSVQLPICWDHLLLELFWKQQDPVGRISLVYSSSQVYWWVLDVYRSCSSGICWSGKGMQNFGCEKVKRCSHVPKLFHSPLQFIKNKHTSLQALVQASVQEEWAICVFVTVMRTWSLMQPRGNMTTTEWSTLCPFGGAPLRVCSSNRIRAWEVKNGLGQCPLSKVLWKLWRSVRSWGMHEMVQSTVAELHEGHQKDPLSIQSKVQYWNSV